MGLERAGYKKVASGKFFLPRRDSVATTKVIMWFYIYAKRFKSPRLHHFKGVSPLFLFLLKVTKSPVITRFIETFYFLCFVKIPIFFVSKSVSKSVSKVVLKLYQ